MEDGKIDSLASDIDGLLAAGGFCTKGFTISGRKPSPLLSKDGVSVSVLGSKWLSEEDEIQLNVGPVNFSKKKRGRKEESAASWVIPEKLTKRICAGKFGEMFDLTGLALPITAAFKIDLHDLHSKYGWDDKMSEDDRKIWSENFDMMNNLNSVVWGRAVLPADAASYDIELIGAGDASEKVACAACYIRFRRMDGSYSCQLLLAKSRIVPEGTTLPRAELLAATLNAHVVEIVRRALKRHNIVKVIYVLDSEISLHWIASQTKPLKPWIRNRVLEILRFTTVAAWFHLKSEDNPVDLPTRKGAKLSDVDKTSEWVNGKPWMHRPIDELKGTVLNDVNDIKLRIEQVAVLKKEQLKMGRDLCNSGEHLADTANMSAVNAAHHTVENSHVYIAESPADDVTSVVRERLKFSKYLIDPNKFRFTKVVRILAVIIKTARNWLSVINRNLISFPLVNNKHTKFPSIEDKVQKFELDTQVKVTPAAAGEPNVTDVLRKVAAFITTESDVNKPQMKAGLQDDVILVLSDAEIQHSLDYLFRKATEELKSYVHPKHYANISVERNGVVYYTGRLCNEDISFEGCDSITQKMLDLTKETFVVPVVDRHSPLAYSIVNDVHWYHKTARHSGVETTIRALMTIVHILNVRQLVKLFKKNCKRCRYIMKRTLDIMMARGSRDQLHVAPPFYVTQVDLCGSFDSYSTHHTRTKVKIWIAVFVCSTTGMTSLKMMQGYDTAQFLLAFTRFACELGFPKKLLIDAGSQLVSGCEKATLNMKNIKGELNREYGIEFDKAPVGGHNFHGKVERKIRTVRESLQRSIHKARLTVVEWETLCSEISNSINDLPVAIGNETEDLESLDLITPNRLRIGRNNARSPIGPLELTGKVDRILQLKTDVFQSWWETWLVSAPPKLVPHPKWFKSDDDLKVGDIVLFDKAEGSLVDGEYHFGIVEDSFLSKDNQVRTVKLRYRNADEATGYRTTIRAARGLVVIHRVDEIDLMEEVGNAALDATGYYLYSEGVMRDYGVKK